MSKNTTPSANPVYRRFVRALDKANAIRPKAAGRPFAAFVNAIDEAARIYGKLPTKVAPAADERLAKVALAPQFKRALARVG